MRSSFFEEVNRTLGPPKDWDSSGGKICHHLSLYVNAEDNYVVSGWKPSTEDLKELNAGGLLFLQIHGGQPPVSLYTVTDGIPNNIDDRFFTEIPPANYFGQMQRVDYCQNRVFARDYSTYQDFVDAVLDKVNM